jgi:hypothetical protein
MLPPPPPRSPPPLLVAPLDPPAPAPAPPPDAVAPPPALARSCCSANPMDGMARMHATPMAAAARPACRGRRGFICRPSPFKLEIPGARRLPERRPPPSISIGPFYEICTQEFDSACPKTSSKAADGAIETSSALEAVLAGGRSAAAQLRRFAAAAETRFHQTGPFLAGEAGLLLGACSRFSDTLLESQRPVFLTL